MSGGLVENTNVLNMILKFAKGHYSLAISYWGVLWALNILVGLCFVGMFFFIKNKLVMVSLFLIYLAFIIIILIGTWNSASRYIEDKRKNEQNPFWGYAAKTYLVVVPLSVILKRLI